MMIDKITKIAEIWKALPVVPRRLALFSVFGGFVAYMTLRIAWVIKNLDNIGEMSLRQFFGF